MATLEQRFNYIQSSIIYLGTEIYLTLHSVFRRWCPIVEENCDTYESYLQACVDNDVVTVERALKKNDDFSRNEGLARACAHGNVDVAKILVDNGADDLNRGLKVSCKNNRATTAELMVQKGAKTVIGLRHASSVNITRMLYRYDQDTKNIN